MVEKHNLIRECKSGGMAEQECLVGSSILQSTYLLKDGGTLQLGDIVRLAWKISKLSVADWNALADDAREERVAAALYHYRTEINGEI